MLKCVMDSIINFCFIDVQIWATRADQCPCAAVYAMYVIIVYKMGWYEIG